MKSNKNFHVAGLLGLLLVAPGVQGELGEDTHIQETGEIRIEVDRQVFEEFARMFALGYPPATVMMHAVSTGMSINDILYIAVKSDLGRAQEFYDTAASLLPALPGWACQADSDAGRYTREVSQSELGPDPSVRDLARLYFDENRRITPFPKWPEGNVHLEASVSELADLVTEQQWYIAGQDDGSSRSIPNRPVFVSLYRHNGEIIVDSGFQRIRRAREQGIATLPVVLVYNDNLHRSISSFEDDVTVGELADEFYGDGIQLTAVPEWKVGDHHKAASVEELRELVDIPDQEDVPAERWQEIEERIRANGMALPEPLLMTLVRSGQGNAWVNEPETLAVAEQLGMESLPVVLFYHQIDRRPCGEPSTCEELLCEAATAAGASDQVCGNGQGQTTAAADGAARTNLEGTHAPMAAGVSPRLYEGLSYTQNQCTS